MGVEFAKPLLYDCSVLFQKGYLSWDKDKLNFSMSEQIVEEEYVLGFTIGFNLYAKTHNRPLGRGDIFLNF